MSHVIWHDVECGGYTADLALWRELARSPVLDVGAGTGRVAADLARRGHDVTALDVDAELLAELRRRAPGVTTIRADAQDFALGRRFASILVPMQTIQLLDDRAGLLQSAAAHLEPGGILAVALSDVLEEFEGPLPAPDVRGRFVSQPTAIRISGGIARLERERFDGDTVTHDVIELRELTPGQLEDEARAAGLQPHARHPIAETEDHVGSTVVVLRG